MRVTTQRPEPTQPIDVRVPAGMVRQIDAYAARLAMERGHHVPRSTAARELLFKALNTAGIERGRP